MSDASKSEPPASPEAVAPVTTPAEPAVVVEPAATEVAAPVPPVVEKKRSRAIGGWAFALGLLTVIGDVVFVVVAVTTSAGLLSQLSAALQGGELSAILGGVFGVVIYALIVFGGGFLVAGVAALLGLIALISGRGRVLGLFGLLFAAAAILVRVLLIAAVSAGNLDQYTSVLGG